MGPDMQRSNLVLVQPLTFDRDEREFGVPGRAFQHRLGQTLRSMYDEMCEAPMPERMKTLLRGLEERLD